MTGLCKCGCLDIVEAISEPYYMRHGFQPTAAQYEIEVRWTVDILIKITTNNLAYAMYSILAVYLVGQSCEIIQKHVWAPFSF